MTHMKYILALLVALVAPAFALPIGSLQQFVGRPWSLRGPAVSQAPHADKIGVKFRMLVAVDDSDVGQWRTIETMVPIGIKMRVDQNLRIPPRPESMQITSIPANGLRVARHCIVHPTFDDVAAADTIGSGARTDMVIVGDMDGEVPLYRHSEGGLLAEEQEVVAITCF